MSRNNVHPRDHRDLLFKIMVVGEPGCGKTSLIRRYVDRTFESNYRTTIGVDFRLKTVESDARTTVRLQLWDIAGQERHGNMTRVYYKESAAALIVCDLINETTLAAALRWKEDIDSKVLIDDEPIPVLLVGNKVDLILEKSAAEKRLEAVAREHRFAGFMLTSAKTDENVEAAFSFITKEILKRKSNLIRGEEDIALLQPDRSLRQEKPPECLC